MHVKNNITKQDQQSHVDPFNSCLGILINPLLWKVFE